MNNDNLEIIRAKEAKEISNTYKIEIIDKFYKGVEEWIAKSILNSCKMGNTYMSFTSDDWAFINKKEKGLAYTLPVKLINKLKELGYSISISPSYSKEIKKILTFVISWDK